MDVDYRESSLNRPQCALVETDPNGAGPEINRIGPLTGPVEIGTDKGVPLVELRLVSGTAQACWEWITPSPPSTLRSVTLGVVVIAKPELLALGVAHVMGCLAPITAVATSTSRAPLPRFVDDYRFLNAFAVIEP